MRVFGNRLRNMLFGAAATAASGCEAPTSGDDDGPAGQVGIKFTASVDNLVVDAKRAAPLHPLGCDVSTSEALTPTAFRVALVNFWLSNADGDINLINPDELAPSYDEERPLLLDFTADGATRQIFDLAAATAPGSYTGYKMQVLYMEMELPLAFHLPIGFDSAETAGYANVGDLVDTEVSRRVRLYFNAQEPYWKRDWVVELDPGSGEWYWLRRELEDDDAHRNFFIATDTEPHPPGGPGPDSVVDLFNDPEFWGDEADYQNPDAPIVLGTHSTVGGVDATLDGTLEIPAEIDAFYNVEWTMDVTETFAYGALDSNCAAPGTELLPAVLDLGPGVAGERFGDIGLHPLLPRFSVGMTVGDEDAHPDAAPGFQIPQECADDGLLEPTACRDAFCPDHGDDPFCAVSETR